MTRREKIVCADLDDLARRAAAEWVRTADEAIARAGRFAVALSGGNTPRALYAKLAGEVLRSRIAWERWHFFWGDERSVPPDHADSNYRMAFEALLSRVPVPAANIHRIETERGPAEAAAAYETALRDFFAMPRGGFPRFDLVLLGIGEEGHTASLFPGSAALLAWADTLSELKTICYCGRKATMVVRVSPDGAVERAGQQIEIGGNERYVSLCRKHFSESMRTGRCDGWK